MTSQIPIEPVKGWRLARTLKLTRKGWLYLGEQKLKRLALRLAVQQSQEREGRDHE